VSDTLVAGAVAGGVALIAFVSLHAAWIVPIWGMLGMLPVAALLGALAAWSFESTVARGGAPPDPLQGLAFAALLLVTLIPTLAVGLVAGPVDRDRITVPAVVLPLLLAAPAGALVGVLVAGPSAGVALGVAAVALSLTLGHNLPFFPIGSPGWEKAIALVAVPELVAGVAFVAARVVMSGGVTTLAEH
jgi:hypothetical protein